MRSIANTTAGRTVSCLVAAGVIAPALALSMSSPAAADGAAHAQDRKSTRLNSSH